jgi:hypothetical protein
MAIVIEAFFLLYSGARQQLKLIDCLLSSCQEVAQEEEERPSGQGWTLLVHITCRFPGPPLS